jgi:hypothetical protein
LAWEINSRNPLHADFGTHADLEGWKLIIETTKKRAVLELIGKRSEDGKVTSYRTLAREFFISQDAACSHLKRLWRDRLIRSSGHPPTYHEAVRERQSVRDLAFRISRRGVERLQEWARQDDDSGWLR